MSTYWNELHTENNGKYNIVLSWTYEDTDPKDLYDEELWDIQDIYNKIDRGLLTWAIARVQVFKNNVELASEYIGGLLYENLEDIITDGIYSDLKHEAIYRADKAIYDLVYN